MKKIQLDSATFLSLLQSDAKELKNMLPFLSEASKKKIFTCPEVIAFMTSSDYRDSYFLFRYYPEYIRAKPELIAYYLAQGSAVYQYLPESYQLNRTIASTCIKQDALNYLHAPDSLKADIHVLYIATQSINNLYQKYQDLAIHENVYNLMGVEEEEKELFDAIPEAIKIKLNIAHLTRSNCMGLCQHIERYFFYRRLEDTVMNTQADDKKIKL